MVKIVLPTLAPKIEVETELEDFAKGESIWGDGVGAPTIQAPGPDGTVIIYDAAAPNGIRFGQILGGMRLVHYAESEGVSNTTSNTYQNKINESYNPNAGDHIVHAFAEITTPSGDKVVDLRLMVDGTEECYVGKNVSDPDIYAGRTLQSRRLTLTAGAKDFQVQWRLNPLDSGETVRIRRARLFIFEVVA